jgi:hypothetical protein
MNLSKWQAVGSLLAEEMNQAPRAGMLHMAGRPWREPPSG